MSDTTAGILQIGLLVVLLAAVHVPLGDYMARVYTASEHCARRARRVPRDGRRPRRRPAVVRLPAQRAGVLARQPALPVRLPARAAAPAALARLPRRQGRPGVEHRGVVRHQHELAVVLRREHDGLPGADGRPRGAELRVRRRRHRRRGRPGPRLHPPQDRPARQLLGRPDPRLPADPAAAVVRVRDRADRRRRRPELPRRTTRSPRSRTGTRPSPAARSPPRRPSRSSAPTAAASTTRTPRTRSRTRPRGRTCSRSSCCW